MINKKPTDWINSENLYMWGVLIIGCQFQNLIPVTVIIYN